MLGLCKCVPHAKSRLIEAEIDLLIIVSLQVSPAGCQEHIKEENVKHMSWWFIRRP